MSAEILRRAAALMRERAEAATPGPWLQGVAQDGEVLADGTGYVGDYEPTAEVYAVDGAGLCLMEIDTGSNRNAAHIASWHPDVALAAAVWLDSHADIHVLRACDERLVTPCPAVTFARAYLGGDA